MNPVQPEELSALLDGELNAARAAEVKAQIQVDPMLRHEFETLRAVDAGWRAAADSAAFTPAVRLVIDASASAPVKAAGSGWLAALTICMALLIGARALLKLAGSDAFRFSLPMLSLLLLVAVVIWLARTPSHHFANAQSGPEANTP